MIEKPNKIFFFGLDELRAFAALSVVLHHLELFKRQEKKMSLYDVPFLKPFISNLGHNGVICFFVLSGFLITYLLLTEKNRYGTIKIKDFYIRRMLRIWPLYFLITVIGFVVMPVFVNFELFANQTYYPGLVKDMSYMTSIFFILFLSNVALALHKPIAAASQSWSVSLEEQFYLIWPWIVIKFSNVKLLCVIAILFFLKMMVNLYIGDVFGNTSYIARIVRYFQIEYMCVGAIGAIVFFYNWHQRLKYFLINKAMVWGMLLLLILEITTFNHSIIIAILFFYFIYILIERKIEVKFAKFLGRISYGIYMYHPLMMFICFSISAHFFPNSLIRFNLLYYFLTVSSTILLSSLSYKYFESYFLKFKSKYTLVASGTS